MKVNIVLFCTVLLMVTAIATGKPANPHIIRTMEINGEQVKVRQWGDEFAHGFETLDGFTIIKNRQNNVWYYAALDDTGKLIPSEHLVGKDNPRSYNLQQHLRHGPYFMKKILSKRNYKRMADSGKKTEQIVGETKVLAIFIEYQDQPFTHDIETFQQLFFSRNPDEPRSMTDYYHEVSYGKFRINGKATGWYTAKNDGALFRKTGCRRLREYHIYGIWCTWAEGLRTGQVP